MQRDNNNGALGKIYEYTTKTLKWYTTFLSILIPTNITLARAAVLISTQRVVIKENINFCGPGLTPRALRAGG